MYKQVELSILQFSSFTNSKTDGTEKIRKMIHLDAKFWLKLKNANANQNTNKQGIIQLKTQTIASAFCNAITKLTRL